MHPGSLLFRITHDAVASAPAREQVFRERWLRSEVRGHLWFLDAILDFPPSREKRGMLAYVIRGILDGVA